MSLFPKEKARLLVTGLCVERICRGSATQAGQQVGEEPETARRATLLRTSASAHLEDNGPVAAGIGDRAERLHLVGGHRRGAVAPGGAHESQHLGDLLVGELYAVLRHAVGIRRALYDERLGAGQHEIDERRRIAVERDRIAGERRYIRGSALAVGAMAGDAVAEEQRLARRLL